MGYINKIKVGDTSYNIVPQLGNGLKEAEGTVELNIGSGLKFKSTEEGDAQLTLELGTGLMFDGNLLSFKNGQGLGIAADGAIVLRLGTGLVINDGGNIVVNLGTACSNNNAAAQTGIAVNGSEFNINTVDFCNYLKSLGVAFV